MANEGDESLRSTKIPGAVKVRILSWNNYRQWTMQLEDLCADLEATSLLEWEFVDRNILIYTYSGTKFGRVHWISENGKRLRIIRNACEHDNLKSRSLMRSWK